MNNNEILPLLHNHLYELLIAFDELCQKHNFVYYLAYGTLLGAVRHQGFIPWDDDIDVVMPREDYERLLSIYKEVLPMRYELQHSRNTENYFLNFAKITDKNTTVVEKVNATNDLRVGGVYIDIFPIDGMGDDYKKALKRSKKSRIYRVILDTSIQAFDRKKRALWKQALIKIGRLFNPKKLQERITKYLKSQSYQSSKYVSMSAGSNLARKVMDKAIYGDPVRIKFREHLFNAPSQPEEYLRVEYGKDYMQPPPVEKRFGHSTFVYIDLSLPYAEFDMKLLLDRSGESCE